MYILKEKDLQEALELWNETFKVFVPTEEKGKINLSEYKGSYEKNYVNFSTPFRSFLFEKKEELFSWEKCEDHIEIKRPEIDTNKKLYFGVRPCDVYSIPYLDLFFTERYKDDIYSSKRRHTYIIGLNCTEPGENCFCSSTGTGPFAKKGYDVIFTPINDYYLIEVATKKGEELADAIKDILEDADDSQLKVKSQVLKSVKDKFVRKVELEKIEKVMQHTFDNPIWEEHAKHCKGCTRCTIVCPTCTCFNVVEDNKGDHGSRSRVWGSCQTPSFTKNAGDHNPRDPVAQVRYRILDKMKYIPERFDYKGCTGCGRCIEVCPAFIDIVDTVNTLQSDIEVGITHKLHGVDHYINEGEEFNHLVEDHEREDHHINGRCEDIYLPEVAIIKEIIEETSQIKKFILQFEDKSIHNKLNEIVKNRSMGQFYEITVFGVGEIAISIPFGSFNTDTFEFYIKRVGKVTKVIHEMEVGDKVGLRGPFGKAFPHEVNYGKDILIIGSGVGLAPVRAPLERIIEERDKFGRVVFIVSGSSYEGVIFKNDLKEFEKKGIEVLYALGEGTNEVNAHVGRINDLLPGLGLNWENASSIVCASPSRIKAVAKDLLSFGMKGEEIKTSLETHMRCGIGKCGHCKVGNKYMCIDGPVFNYNEMMNLPPEF